MSNDRDKDESKIGNKEIINEMSNNRDKDKNESKIGNKEIIDKMKEDTNITDEDFEEMKSGFHIIYYVQLIYFDINVQTSLENNLGSDNGKDARKFKSGEFKCWLVHVNDHIMWYFNINKKRDDKNK